MSTAPTRDRLDSLRDLLLEGQGTSQEALRENLAKQGYDVTQSTISRDLRRLGAIRAVDAEGRTVYRLAEEFGDPVITPGVGRDLSEMVRDIQASDALIVIHTSPGSASLIARHLDHARPGGILGTIAGDDTIFVAPPSSRSIRVTLKKIEESLGIV